MFENPRKYVVENVLPSYKDFIDQRAKLEWGEDQLLRKGIYACLALFHLREQIPSGQRPTLQALKLLNPNYEIIANVANASKHHTISRYNPRISSASQIEEVMILTKFEDVLGIYYSAQIEIVVNLNDGTIIKLISILQEGLQMWRDILDSLEIIDLKPIDDVEECILVTREEALSRNSVLQITQGEEYSWKFHLEKYNYETHKTEPMDLTGYGFRFEISKPPDKVCMRVNVNDPHLEEVGFIDFDVPLSEDQGIHYLSLVTDETKMDYLKSIIDSNIELKHEIDSKILQMIQTSIHKDL